jgi:hypothetical protein
MTALVAVAVFAAAHSVFGGEAAEETHGRARPSEAQLRDGRARLTRELENERLLATSESEKAYLSAYADYQQARWNKDDAAIARAIDALLAVAQAYPGDRSAARALKSAANAESGLYRYPEAQSLYERAFVLFDAHPEWPDRDSQALECGIRVGDCLLGKNPQAAVSVWIDTFRKYNKDAMAAWIPEKVRLAYKQFLPPAEALQKSVEFFDEAIRTCPEASYLDRFELERFWGILEGRGIYDGKSEDPLIPKDVVLAELNSLLGKYPPGTSRFVDLQRQMLLSIKADLERLPKSPDQAHAESLAASGAEKIRGGLVTNVLDEPAEPVPVPPSAADVPDAPQQAPAPPPAPPQAPARIVGVPLAIAALIAAAAAIVYLLLARFRRPR